MTQDVSTLFPSQRELLDAGYLSSGEDWLISAPTGSGKTKMGEWAITKALDAGDRAAYLAPLKAIVEERLSEWQCTYSAFEVGSFTGSAKRNSKPTTERLLLFTPEKLASYLMNWKAHLDWLSSLSVVVIDEFHLIADLSRGATLEAAINRLQRINPYVRIVGLSATVSNVSELADWLNARVYETEWRPIPVSHRLRRFKKATDKVEMLCEEITDTKAAGGKTLVFVNSRRRAEAVAMQLQEMGFVIKHTHAGLTQADQTKAHQAFRSGQLDALIATSTLEMGVNLPARKVVVYDSYAFEGNTFQAISQQRYLQYSGRAGRAGLDPYGEAVLFAPIWDRNAESYLTKKPDPIKSSLFCSCHLQTEILYEISSRLSVSEEHLETNFARRTLWRRQGGSKTLHTHVQSLLKAGLLSSAHKDARTYLSATALGRIATQMSISPESVILLRQIFENLEHPTEFDLLLALCLCLEVTPKLGFNFEEVDALGDFIVAEPSTLLDASVLDANRILNHVENRPLLSAIKCASILISSSRLSSFSTLAECFDCYESDLISLKKNAVWLCEAGLRIFGVLNRKRHLLEHEDSEATPPLKKSIHEATLENLKLMIEFGVPKGAVGLVKIAGIGTKRAQILCNEGIFTAHDVALLSPDQIAVIVECGLKTAFRIKSSAEALAKQSCNSIEKFGVPVDSPIERSPYQPNRQHHVDPYRLRRALELSVDHLSAEVVRISGGTEPHTVSVLEDSSRRRSYSCDCLDYEKGTQQCKHILRARLALNDNNDLKSMISRFSRSSETEALRYSLTDIWLKVSGSFDAYNFRKTDYTGKEFLEKQQPMVRKRR